MLGKLLKYEIRATGRTFLPLFAVLFLFTVINKIFFIISPNEFSFPQGISMMVYVITLVGIFVATMLITIQRFYKNLLGDEGYLMFTLPVKTWELITSKLIVSGIWSIVSCIVACFSICVMAIGMDDLRAFPEAWRQIWHDFDKWFGLSPLAFFLELVLLMLAGLALGILVVYLSIALGHQLNNKKLLGSFGAFLVVTTVIQSISAVAITVLSGLEELGMFNWVGHLSLDTIMHMGMWCGILYEVFFAAVCFVLTNLLLSKRLNLE